MASSLICFVQRQGSIFVLSASTDDASLRQSWRTTVTKLRLSTEDRRDEPQWLFTTLPRHRWNDENQSIACKEKEIILDSPPCAFGLKPLIRLIHSVGTYTVTLHKWESLPTQDHHVNQDILHIFFIAYGQDAHLRHMNTLLLDRAQSFVHLAHPTSSYPGTSAWALNLNNVSLTTGKCFQMLSDSSLPRTSQVDAFEETLPPSQAREFGHRQALLMFFRWSIMPQSQSLRKWYKVGLQHSYWPQVQAKKRYKDVQSSFAPQLFLTKQPGNISMAVALHMLAPSGHGTQCWTALRFAMVFSVMFFTKTEPGSHFVHPMPSLRL